LSGKYSRLASRSSVADREDSITLGRALKVLTASRQTGLFFVFLLVLSLSLFMQDAILEPYGGEVFGMKISETTQLNAAFGMGTLLGIIITGMWVVPRIGKKRAVTIGCLWAALCLLLITFSGVTADPALLMAAVFSLWHGFWSVDPGSHRADAGPNHCRNRRYLYWSLGVGPGHRPGSATVLGGGVLDLGKVAVQTV
jgi:BCD family chlorophyll transporter-like MFS transporter